MKKFFSVKVGKRTKRGGFNELHSFVCQADVTQTYVVIDNYQKKYEGFDVVAEEVLNIETMPLKPSQNPIPKGKINDLQKEVKELKKQLLPEGVTNYRAKIEGSSYPNEVKYKLNKVIDLEHEVYELKKESEQLINDHLVSINKEVEWCRRDKGFSDSYQYYSFEARLKGELVKTRKNDENE